MEIKGTFHGITLDYKTRHSLITFSVPMPPSDLENAFDDMKGELTIKVAKFSPKRSLNANAYFHAMCREIALKIERSEVFVKNRMIAISGQPELDENGNTFTIKTNVPLDKMWEQEVLHVKLLKVNIENGKEVYFYAVMKPSREYTVKEMSQLIESTVEECKALGIPTISTADMERMLNAWGK